LWRLLLWCCTRRLIALRTLTGPLFRALIVQLLTGRRNGARLLPGPAWALRLGLCRLFWISPLLLPSGWCARRLAAGSLAGTIRSRLVFVTRSISATTSLARHFTNGARCESLSSRAFNRRHTGTFVCKNCSLTSVNIHGLALEVPDHPRLIDDIYIVDDEIVWPETGVEQVHANEGIERWRRCCEIWAYRGPTNVIVAVAPTDPCGRPLRSRYPKPAHGRLVSP